MINQIIDYSWQEYASCSTLSIDMFFPGHGKNIPTQAVEACQSCPVKNECLEHALKYEEYGYWANTSAKDRIKMRKERGIKLESITADIGKLVDEQIKEMTFLSLNTATKKIQSVAQCGTRSGYNAHLRKRKVDPNESPCESCKQAHRASMAKFNQDKKDREQCELD